MGKRSRKRGAGPEPRTAAVAASRSAPQAPSRRARLDEAPQPVWAPFPLTEICILLGLVLLVIGFVTQAAPALLAGLGLAMLAAAELAVREHFAGYRSHSSLLSGMCAVVVAAPLAVAGLPQAAVIGIGIAVFAAAFGLLRAAFMKRSGGLGFRA